MQVGGFVLMLGGAAVYNEEEDYEYVYVYLKRDLKMALCVFGRPFFTESLQLIHSKANNVCTFVASLTMERERERQRSTQREDEDEDEEDKEEEDQEQQQ